MKKNNKESGFVLMESLISLAIIAVFTGSVFPFLIGLFTLREETKREIEYNRLLYDTAAIWNSEENKTHHYSIHNKTVSSIHSPSSIKLIQEDKTRAEVEIISIEWKE